MLTVLVVFFLLLLLLLLMLLSVSLLHRCLHSYIKKTRREDKKRFFVFCTFLMAFPAYAVLGREAHSASSTRY